MKAVVVEIKKDKAIVLDSDGRYRKIAGISGLRVGYEIDLNSMHQQKTIKKVRIASIAAAFLIVVGGMGAYSYSQPYSYVEIDINPSVMFTANIFDRIIKAEGFNDGGDDIIGQDSYYNMSLQSGIDCLLEKAVEKGYIKRERDNAVLVTIASKNPKKANEITVKTNDVVMKELNKSNVNSDVAVETVNIKEHRQQSQESVVSPGRSALIEKLAESNPELDIEELKRAPVKELIKSINEMKKQEKEESKQQKIWEQQQKEKEKEEKKQQKENRNNTKNDSREERANNKNNKNSNRNSRGSRGNGQGNNGNIGSNKNNSGRSGDRGKRN